jgi:hypothetical protein
MTTGLTPAPRYRLDDESFWLMGIDPMRRYWVAVNGCEATTLALGGLHTSSMEELSQALLDFRRLKAGETVDLPSFGGELQIHCIDQDCYAIAQDDPGAAVWHLFDRETLEALLITAHPDWMCSSADLELGRKLLNLSCQKVFAA